MAQNTIADPHVLTPLEELQRAISEYLNISRNKNNRQFYASDGIAYWSREEAAWERLERAIENYNPALDNHSQ